MWHHTSLDGCLFVVDALFYTVYSGKQQQAALQEEHISHFVEETASKVYFEVRIRRKTENDTPMYMPSLRIISSWPAVQLRAPVFYFPWRGDTVVYLTALRYNIAIVVVYSIR